MEKTQTLTKSAAIDFLNGITISYPHFRSGENEYYLANLKMVAKTLAESKLPESMVLRVSNDEVHLFREGRKDFCLYSIYMDTFHGRPWDCKTYCKENFERFKERLGVVEELLC